MTKRLLSCVVITYVISTLSMTSITQVAARRRQNGVPPNINNPTNHRNWKLFDMENCGYANSANRIIGGYTASIGAYPWLTRIGYVGVSSTGKKSMVPVFRCGGALITKFYVLTAAHCTVEEPNVSLEVVRFGEFDVYSNPDCDSNGCADSHVDYDVAEVLSHAQYGKPIFRNDISLLRVAREITFTKYIRPICMLFDSLLTKNFIGQTAEVAGWGVVNTKTRASSTKLQALRVPIVPLDRCDEHFHTYVPLSNSQMCAGGKYKEDSCSGDSGGPLMKVEAVGDYPPRYYIVGVVSFGARDCAVDGVPAVYTRMSSFMSWMLDLMK